MSPRLREVRNQAEYRIVQAATAHSAYKRLNRRIMVRVCVWYRGGRWVGGGDKDFRDGEDGGESRAQSWGSWVQRIRYAAIGGVVGVDSSRDGR